MNPSDTPRTDEECGTVLYDPEECSDELVKQPRDGSFVWADFARQLERELNAQIEANNNLKEHIRILNFGASALAYKKP